MFRARQFNYSMRRKPVEMRWWSVNGYFENQSSTPFNLRPSTKIHQNTPRCFRREFLRRLKLDTDFSKISALRPTCNFFGLFSYFSFLSRVLAQLTSTQLFHNEHPEICCTSIVCWYLLLLCIVRRLSMYVHREISVPRNVPCFSFWKEYWIDICIYFMSELSYSSYYCILKEV